MSRNFWVLAGGLLVAALVIGLQIKAVGDLRREVVNLRAEVQGVQSVPAISTGQPQRISPEVNVNAGLQARLANLEQSMASLAKTSELLMDRGVLPPSEERMAQMQQRFFDSSASDGDRLRSLRLLRRNNQQLDDTVVAQAVNWLQTSTNGNTRRELLQQLDGVTNAALKQPLLAMLQTETARNVREELVDVLSDFANDPAVESKLWDLALNDPNGNVREEAQDALTGGRLTPERVARLQEKAANPNASLDERLLSLRALREANVQAPEVVSEMASIAQNATDPVMRAKLFQAFDGINDPNLMAPLVHGLQDPNPVVRENAVDALSTFSSDPRIQEWLNHIIQNDTDPRVKREAHSVLEQSQRRGRRER